MSTTAFLVSLIAIAAFTWHILRKKLSYVRLPSAPQAPWYERLFVEPDPPQVAAWANSVQNQGLIRYYGVLHSERILVTSPEGIRDIIGNHAYAFQKPPATRTILTSILGDGLVVAEGEAHRAQKKLLQPAFSVRQVKDMYPLFWTKTMELVECLRVNASDKTNLNDLIGRTTLDIIGAGGLGLQLGTLANLSTEFFQAYRHAFRPSPAMQRYRLLAFILPEWLLNMLPLQRNEDLTSASGAVKKLIREALSERKRDSDNGNGNGKDIISILLNTGSIGDVKILSNQAMTILGGGHDTATSTLLWAIYEMSRHAETQEKLRDEIRTVLTSRHAVNGSSTQILEQLESLPYLSAFCNEVLRMHPAIPNLHREATKSVHVNGVVFPGSTQFTISITGINRDSDLWQEDPSMFRPERWLKHSNGGVKEREGFLSFGSGPRTCIGEKFARAEMACLLAGLVANFEMEFVGQGPPRMAHGGVSRMIDPLAVRMKALEPW